MEIKKPRFISATTKKDSRDTTLAKSLYNVEWGKLLYGKYFVENKEALSTIYNLSITQALKDDVDCLILIHDDVILEEDPIPKLEKLFDDYDLVGVAGASKVELKSPALWHLMGGGFVGGNLHGSVQHTHQDDTHDFRKNKTFFGPYPHRVVMIDGVFMALNRKVMETISFDDKCPSKFHMYDIGFSLSCHLAGLKVGVGNISITHESPGLREVTQDWVDGDKYFISKYADL
jgi:hypothetical protein